MTVKENKKQRKMATEKGTYFGVTQYEDGESYFKLSMKEPQGGFTPNQFRLIAEFIERIEDGDIELEKGWSYYFNKSLKKHTPRYLIANVMKCVFSILSTSITFIFMKLGLDLLAK